MSPVDRLVRADGLCCCIVLGLPPTTHHQDVPSLSGTTLSWWFVWLSLSDLRVCPGRNFWSVPAHGQVSTRTGFCCSHLRLRSRLSLRVAGARQRHTYLRRSDFQAVAARKTSDYHDEGAWPASTSSWWFVSSRSGHLVGALVFPQVGNSGQNLPVDKCLRGRGSAIHNHVFAAVCQCGRGVHGG